MLLGAGCRAGGRPPDYLAGAPAEGSLEEPVVDSRALRPAVFGYGDASAQLALRGCDAPLEVSLGDIDPRFGLGRRQALFALGEAMGIWDAALGRRAFRYSPRSRIGVDFVFDERQELLIKQQTGRDPLDDVMRRYARLEDGRNRDMTTYQQRVEDYDARVAAWNARGGAPDDVLRALHAEKEQLRAEQARLNGLLPRIAALAADINSRSRPLTEADMRYLHAGLTKRTTRGDLTTALHIDIFMFASWEALPLILAHELGHALGMEHVPTHGSIMYGGPNPQRRRAASAEDVAELRRVCPSGGASLR